MTEKAIYLDQRRGMAARDIHSIFSPAPGREDPRRQTLNDLERLGHE